MSALRLTEQQRRELKDFLIGRPEIFAPLLREYAKRCDTWIYAIRAGDDGPVKIGRTNNPDQRLRTLQTASPLELHGIAAWRAMTLEEAQLHEEFAHLRIRGEWFKPSADLLETVEAAGGHYEWEPRA